jgi:hypothetical protein
MTRSLQVLRPLWALQTLLALGLLAAAPPSSPAQAIDTSRWDAYLDYAYIYVSADPQALEARLGEYGGEAGMTLAEYLGIQTRALEADAAGRDERVQRRVAIAHLLRYLAEREPRHLDRSVEAIAAFEGQRGRHENLYWLYTIRAHRALEKGRAADFTREMLTLWRDVVVPLESSYDTLQALSLSQSPNSGFVAAIPYVFENVARLILIRSQEMGLQRDLDPLAALVRLLADGRVGAHPDVIPKAVSAQDYLNRILQRLDGPESDGGSLTFTLLLFEAGKYHDRARSLLASEGLGDETIKAIGVASGAYHTALNLAQTVQGQAAVYSRVLRQLGEVFAAKQRLGVDPYVESPFSIEGAIGVYAELQRAGAGDGWRKIGYRHTGYDSYVESMRGLWEEIQEASLNSADYYLTRAIAQPARAADHVRSAARACSRYLDFFAVSADKVGEATMPDSAYFAAYEAARGYADAFLAYEGTNPTPAEIDLAASRYLLALRIYPFDRQIWPSLAAALERQGRAADYLALARPLADGVARSRHLDGWIQNREPGADSLGTAHRALADELVVMYLGFANASGMEELEASLEELRLRKQDGEARLRSLAAGESSPEAMPAALDAGAPAGSPVLEQAEREREMREARESLARIEKQIAARSRALPLFKATLATDSLIGELRSQRAHPVHTLLRRMYYEGRS